MDMLFVRVGRHKKSVAALRPAHSQFVADTVRLFWCNLPGIEGHAYLVAEHVRFLFLFPPRYGFIAGLRKQKFLRHRGRVALIGGEIFTFGFLRVLSIVQTVPDSRRYGFAFACMARQERGCRQIVSLPSKENGGPSEPPPVLRANMARSSISLQGTGTEQISRRPALRSANRPPPASHTEKAGKRGTGTQTRPAVSA